MENENVNSKRDRTIDLQSMIVRNGGASSARGVQRSSTNKSGKNPFVNNALVEEWPDEGDVWLASHLNAEELVWQWVDDDEHIAKFRRNYSSSIISAMLRPNDVDFIVTQMPHLHGLSNLNFVNP